MVDALASGASVHLYVEVQVLSRAPWSDHNFPERMVPESILMSHSFLFYICYSQVQVLCGC
jgi:hypothetical protein